MYTTQLFQNFSKSQPTARFTIQMAAKPIFEEKFSPQKVSSQLNVLFKWLQRRHLKNLFLFKMARKVLSRSIGDQNSQNVSSLLNLLYTSEIALTFEKFSGQ